MNKYTPEELKREFIIEDMAQYWLDKMKHYGSIMEEWYNKGVTVSVMDGKVVEIHGAWELDSEQKHEIAIATEGYLYAERQYECAKECEK